MAMLAVGTAVLVCGLGWMLVSYSEKLEEKVDGENDDLMNKVVEAATKGKIDIKMVDKRADEVLSRARAVKARREFAVTLNGFLSAGIITMIASLLVSAIWIYLKATNNAKPSNWWLVAIIMQCGAYVIIRSSCIAISRTQGALAELRRGSSINLARRLRSRSRSKVEQPEILAMQKIATEVWLFLAVLALLTASILFFDSVFINRDSGQFLVPLRLLLVIESVAFVLIRWTFLLVKARRGTPSDAGESTDEPKEIPAEEIESEPALIKFSLGRLPETTYTVALLAVLGTLFAQLESQWALNPSVRLTFTLITAGLLPGGVLLGLAYSVAAPKSYRIPGYFTWKPFRDAKRGVFKHPEWQLVGWLLRWSPFNWVP